MRPSMQRCVSTVMKPVMVNSRAKSRNDLFVCTQIENSCNLSIRVNRSLQVSATSRLLHLARPIGLSDGLNKFIFENRKKNLYLWNCERQHRNSNGKPGVFDHDEFKGVGLLLLLLFLVWAAILLLPVIGCCRDYLGTSLNSSRTLLISIIFGTFQKCNTSFNFI